MKIKSFLSLLPLVSLNEAFVVRKATTTSALVLKSSPSDDDTLAKLQHEYKVLQEKLYRDVVIKHDEEDAEKVEEQMLETLTEATKIHEHKQMEIMDDAEHTRMEAQKTRQRAQALKQGGKGKDAAIVNEIEAAYEDLVRYSDYKELEATDKKEAAKLLLDELKENENRLTATLEALKEENKKNHELEKELHTQHRSFLDDVKGAIYAHPDILIGLDPHIL